MNAVAYRAYFGAKKILSWTYVFLIGYLLVVGATTTGMLVYHHEQIAILLGDLAEIQRAEREAPETMRAMKK